MTTEPLPDLRYKLTTPFDTYYVDLWEGSLRDEVRVWVDVRPALGGLIGRHFCRHGKDRGRGLHATIVGKLNDALEEKMGWTMTMDPEQPAV